jgi:hypothetical protein
MDLSSGGHIAEAADVVAPKHHGAGAPDAVELLRLEWFCALEAGPSAYGTATSSRAADADKMDQERTRAT